MIRLYGAVENADVAGGVILHLLEVMGDDDDQLILGHLTEQLNDLSGGLTVQVTRGLVAKEDGGILGQGAGDDGSLLLTARELASLVVDVALQPHAAEQLHGPLPSRLGVLDAQERQLHVLEDGEALDDVVLLEDEGYVLLAVLLPVLLHEVGGGLPLHQKLALLVGIHAADDVQEGRLTRARFTRHGYELSAVEGQIDAADTHGHVVIGYVDLTDISQFKDRLLHGDDLLSR